MGKQNKHHKQHHRTNGSDSSQKYAANLVKPHQKFLSNNGSEAKDIASSAVAPVKLTKQQKRDLKRNGNRVHVNPVSQRHNSHPSHAAESANKTSSSTSIPEKGTSVYKRVPQYPPPSSLTASAVPAPDGFLYPGEAGYDTILKESYDGFRVSDPSAFPQEFHKSFVSAFENLERQSFFQFDLTQPAGLGTKVARTFVTRCLVGIPGITYKYLGLRMFAHPWTKGEVGATDATIAVGKANDILISHSKSLLAASGREEYGSCDYNLTLINRCFPKCDTSVPLKEEPMFQRDQCTVSWHADSCLEHYSSIAVYHHCFEDYRLADGTPTAAAVSSSSSAPLKPPADPKNASFSSDSKGTNPLSDRDHWRVAMRVYLDAEGPQQGRSAEVMAAAMKTITPPTNSCPFKSPKGENKKDKFASKAGKCLEKDSESNAFALAPPLAFPLPSNWSYYLLDDFNHHHQHSVLVGAQSDRVASTHRVSRTEGHTFDYIRRRCLSVAQQKLDVAALKSVRSEQLALTELEFEWIRQFYIQGQSHYNRLVWWHSPMQELLNLWSRLEQRTLTMILALQDAAMGLPTPISAAIVDHNHTEGKSDSSSDKKIHKNASSHKNASNNKVTSGNNNDSNVDVSNNLSNREMKLLAKRRRLAEQVTLPLYDELLLQLEERREKRDGWAARERDPIFRTQPTECAPMPVPFPPVLLPSGLHWISPPSSMDISSTSSLVITSDNTDSTANDESSTIIAQHYLYSSDNSSVSSSTPQMNSKISEKNSKSNHKDGHSKESGEGGHPFPKKQKKERGQHGGTNPQVVRKLEVLISSLMKWREKFEKQSSRS